MKSSTLVAGVALTLANIAFGCSSPPAHPPLETTGTKNPAPSPGGSTPKPDAATPESPDGASGVPSIDGSVGGVCNAANCSGCCDAVNRCQTGTLSAACGVLGVQCVTCSTGTICSGGYCQ